MKLIDLLVQELPKRGGWPDGVSTIKQGDISGKIFPDRYDAKELFVAGHIANDATTGIVTKSQYEAALAASKPQWDGEGLPPVGCECEARFVIGGEWFFFRCVAIDCEIAFGWSGKEPTTLNLSGYEFRPIRSEADKKRDEFVDQVMQWMHHAGRAEVELIYDAIAAGKIPGVKLED